MPPRKEPKEKVTYPATKRKAPPFKPQRPSKLARTDSVGSTKTKATFPRTTSPKQASPATSTTSPAQIRRAPAPSRIPSSPPIVQAAVADLISDTDHISDSSDELPDDPLTFVAPRPKAPRRDGKAAAASAQLNDDSIEQPTRPMPPDIDCHAMIPQPLLLRIMHEHFESKDTKIDKHAIVVLQRYMDLFLREAVARAALTKKADVDEGNASQDDMNWLDRKDLEKVAGGLLFDF